MKTDLLTREQIKKVKEDYQAGTRIELIELVDEPYSKLTNGSKGTVTFVDNAGNIHLDWDEGSTLSLLPYVDKFKAV